MSYKAAVFDLDGTILDTIQDLILAANHTLSINGLPERTPSEIASFVGNGLAVTISRCIPTGTSAELSSKLCADFMSYYAEHCTEHTVPYEGITEVIRQLKESGIKTAVVSNKMDRAVRILCDEHFPGLFEITVGERPDVRRKPAPDSLLTVMKEFGISSAETVYIGDSEVDIETAANAGIDCINVDWGFRNAAQLKESGASVIVSKPADLTELIL